MSAEQRLEELLRRSRVFADFVAGKGSCSAADMGGRRVKSAGSKRRRMQEAEEDAILVKQQQSRESADPVRLTAQPSNIAFGTMRAYQLQALNWLIRLHDIQCNGILADEMGLGKTLESISLLGYLKESRGIRGPHLIIVPKSTSGNWMRELGRWCPSLTTFLFHGTKEERVEMKERVGTTDVCVTTYDMATRERACLQRVQWYYIYIDEAHRIKNEASLLSTVVRTFPSKRRLLITGTPLQNNLHELWALLNYLLPNEFPSAVDFENWFDVTKSDGGSEEKKIIIKRLHTILRPFLLRRLKQDVEKDLPPKIEMKVFTGLSAMQKAWYTKILERDIDTLNSAKGPRMRLLNIVMQLRKVCNHPYLFDGAEVGPPYTEGEHIVNNCGKMALLDKLLSRLKSRGSRVLIFCQMTRMLDILDDYCRFRGYDYCRIDGQTKQFWRDEQMDIFNAPDSKKFIFLLSTRAGGLGINLQTADTVVLYDSDWNPQMDLQAMDRAHRIGQKKQVNVYRFVTDGTIEVKVVERAYRKLFLNAVVIREGKLQEKDKGVKTDELMRMVRFGAEEIFRSKESTVSDEDIDKILERSEERTRKDEEEIKKSYDVTLQDFSLDVTSEGYQTFEGKDYTGKKAAPIKRDWFIAPPKRERKQAVYNVDGYYKRRIQQKKSKPKEFKPSLRYDFQFFDRERLVELEKKIWDARMRIRAQKQRRREVQKALKKAESMRKKLERQRLREQQREAKMAEIEQQSDSEGGGSADGEQGGQSADAGAKAGGDGTPEKDSEEVAGSAGMDVVEDASGGGGQDEAAGAPSEDSKKESEEPADDDDDDNDDEDDDDDDDDDDRGGDNKDDSNDKGAARSVSPVSQSVTPSPSPVPGDDIDASILSEPIDETLLTEAEEKEMKELEEEGFGSWTKKMFTAYIRACEAHGRDDIDNIRMGVPGQTPEEVDRYHETFWDDERYEEIKDWERYIRQIERGEQRIQRLEDIENALAVKVKRHRNPLDSMTFKYPAKKSRQTYSLDEDRFLVWAMNKVGFGDWEALKSEIRSCWLFRFNWFIKTRTTQELNRRCDYLIKLVEKENEELKKREAAKKKKGKSGTKRKKSSSAAKRGKTKKTASANKKRKKAPAGGSKSTRKRSRR